MPKTKISKVAKDLNVALPTVIEFLQKKNISVDSNPNTRIEDDAVQLLMAEFSKDKVIKEKSDSMTERRKTTPVKEPAKQAAPVELGPDGLPVRNKPRFVGRIELDSKGNPVSPVKVAEKTPAPKETPAPKQQPAPEPEKPVKVADTPAPAEKPVEKVVEKPVVVKVEVKEVPAAPAVEKPVEHKPQPPKKEAPAEKKPAEPAVKVKPVETPKQPEPVVVKAEAESDEVFRTEPPKAGATLTVVGKIDLDALNQSTRPKKKSKEERRGERNGATAQGDRKKRKRISGKEKIDIEKTAQQNSGNGGSRRDGGNNAAGSDSRRGGKNGGRGDNRNKRPVHTEVNEEDVQKQVKETLARLTNKDKGQKKGAKWRKEKREAIASREREAAEMEQAESRVLKLTEFVTANDLATMMDIPVSL